MTARPEVCTYIGKIARQTRATDKVLMGASSRACVHVLQAAKARALIEQDRWDTALLAELSQVMRDASICGLGQAAPNPVDCVIRYFPEELA